MDIQGLSSKPLCPQGLAVDMARIARPDGKPAARKPISPHSNGLVAMWSFDEGARPVPPAMSSGA